MKIVLEIKDIDYGALIEKMLPLVADKLSSKEGFAMEMLAKIASMPPSIARKMVDILPDETKEELIAMLVNKNKDKLAKMAESYGGKKGIAFKIENIEIDT